MADTVCVSSPTLTSTLVATSHSLTTTTRTSLTTLPPSTLTSILTTCSSVSPNTTACSISTSLILQPGGISTQIVILTNPVDVRVTALETLYGSSCRTVSRTTPYTPSTDPTPTETPTATSTPTTTSTITTTSYSTFTGTSLMTSDGTTFTSYYTSVSSIIPVSSDRTTTSSSTTSTRSELTTDPLQTNQAIPASGSNNTGAIVGGTLGGIFALGLVALLTWHMIKKSHRFDNLFKDDDTNYYGPPPKKPSVNPYQYDLVGQQDTQPSGFSPPTSPGLRHASLVNEMGILNNSAGNNPGALHTNSSTPLGIGSSNEVGMQGGSDVAYNVPNQTPAHHVRNPSTIPLLVGAVSGHTRPNTSSSRASVASSDPLGPLVTHALPQNTGYPPQQFNSYPPALAAYAQHHGLGQAQVQPQQNLGHNTSLRSSATFLTSAAGSSPEVNPANFVAGSVSRRPTNISQPPQIIPSQRYEDPFARPGSPVAYQGRPVLQVRNAEPSDMFGEGSSSRTFGTPGLSVTGPSTSVVDGKGRPLNLGGEKATLVHLDGGAYEERPRTPAPPAYMEL